MLNALTCWLILIWAVVGCQQQPPKTESKSPTPPATIEPPKAVAAVDSSGEHTTLSAAAIYGPLTASADTLLQLHGRHYYLHTQARLDTTQRLTLDSAGIKTWGYQGYFTFTLRDSLHQLLSRRVLRKTSFGRLLGAELPVVSGVSLPNLLGYSVPLQALVFTISFGAPETDWISETVLLLDLRGQVRRLRNGYDVGGPDVITTLAADGRTLLTSREIIRSNGPPLPLLRPDGELRGALLLNDSLAVTIYEMGSEQPVHDKEGHASQEHRATPKQKHQSNTFVLNTHTGKVVNRFRYNGFYEELGVIIPWNYLRETQTGYFLDDKKGIYTLSGVQPTHVGYLPFDSLARFKAPKRPSELSFKLNSLDKQYQFYIDTLASARIRYQRLPQ